MTSQQGSSSLTPREKAVLALIIDGCTSKAAATILSISPRTIEFHRANILEKMHARNVADLMRAVFEPDPETEVSPPPRKDRVSD